MKANTSAIIGIIGLCALALYPLFVGKFYATGDMRDVTIPIELFFQQQQRTLHLPIWMPQAAFGFPIIAAAQIGFYYPPLLIGRLLPLPIYLPALVLLHTIGAALGSYLFARRLGQSVAASCLTALSIALGAFAWQHITHLNIYLALAWLPWQLLIAHTMASQPTRNWFYTGLFSIGIGIPFLIGQLQIPLLMAAYATLYYAVIAKPTMSARQLVSHIMLIASLGAAISAAQVLPTLELVQHSSRGQQGDFDIVRANQHSYPLYHLPTLIFPRFYGSDHTYWGKRLEIEYGFFIGTVPLILALSAAWNSIKHKGSTRPQLFFWYTGCIAFLLALGSMSPFRLIGLEPSLWVFSAPARWLAFASVSLAYMAGWGLDLLNKKNILTIRYVCIGLWVACLTATAILSQRNIVQWIIAAAERLAGLSNPEQIEKLWQLFTSASTSSLSLASPYTWIPLVATTIIAFISRKYLVKAVVIVSAIELLIIAATTSPTASWQSVIDTPTTVAKLPQSVRHGQARLHVFPPEGGDTGAWFTNPSSRANSTIRRQQKDLLVPLTSAQFQILGTSWPASLDMQAVSDATSELTRNSDSLLSDLNIGATSFVHENTVTIATVESKSRFATIDSFGTETNVQPAINTPTHLQVNVEPKDSSRLIIRDTWFPGWKAMLDGRHVPIHKTGPHLIFRAIDIPPGQHTIDLTYEPSSIAAGLAISLSAFLISCALAGIGYKLKA